MKAKAPIRAVDEDPSTVVSTAVSASGRDKVIGIFAGASLLIALFASIMCVVLYLAISELTALVEEQNSVIGETKAELIALRHVVGSQTAEDVVYLKIKILNKKVDDRLARDIARAVHKQAQVFKKDPDFILSIMHVESNFKPKVRSSMGAIGLMQIMPHWIETLGIMDDLEVPEVNVRYGLQIYAFYEQMYRDPKLALTAYNRGPGPVDSALMTGKTPFNGYAARIWKTYERLRSMHVGGDKNG